MQSGGGSEEIIRAAAEVYGKPDGPVETNWPLGSQALLKCPLCEVRVPDNFNHWAWYCHVAEHYRFEAPWGRGFSCFCKKMDGEKLYFIKHWSDNGGYYRHYANWAYGHDAVPSVG